MKMIKCDSCGYTRNLNPDNANENAYFRIVFQNIHAGDTAEYGTDNDECYDFITMDICPDCLIRAGKTLNHEKIAQQFVQ